MRGMKCHTVTAHRGEQDGGKGVAHQAWQKWTALASLLSSASTSKARGQTSHVPSQLLSEREGEISAAIPTVQSPCVDGGISRLQYGAVSA